MPQYRIHPLIHNRRSAVAFKHREVDPMTLRCLFEAARWAPSSRNEQPWRFLTALRQQGDEFAKLLSSLHPDNHIWAKHASALGVLCVSKEFARTGKVNTHAEHDAGAALAQLSIQAVDQGLLVHPMAGFDPDVLRAQCLVPKEVEILTAFALGYPGSVDHLDEKNRRRELQRTSRRPQQQWVFGTRYGEALRLEADSEAQSVLTFWFGSLDATGCSDPAHQKKWFEKDPDFDQKIEERFAILYADIVSDARQTWLAAASDCLAYVIVLDQFSRNMFRDKPEMYAADPRALHAAVSGLDAGFDSELPFHHRVFLYMPLMHSESLAMQQRCVELFDALARQLSDDSLHDKAQMYLRYAVAHRDIVQRFGRFPHRNQILGRASTPEELEFLKQPGSSF